MFKEAFLIHLKTVILPFWENLRDTQNGGYTGYVDFDLQKEEKSPKGCILNSRILWFFSSAATVLKDPSLLPYAHHAYQFMNAFYDTENGGFYWSATYDGKPLDTLKHTYNQAFAIYALCAYYEATGNETALQDARRLFELVEERCGDAFGYREASDKAFTPVSNEKLSENGVLADRTMNTLLHILEAYTELYRISRDRQVGERLKEVLRLFAHQVYNPVKNRLDVFFDTDMKPIIDLHSYGHDIEATWLIDRALKAVHDPALTQALSPITNTLAENILSIAFDGSSLKNECERGTVNTARVWWVQAEGMVGFVNAWQKTGSAKYMDAAESLWAYIQEKVVDKRPGGEWFWDLNQDGVPESRKPIVEPWKCPYHNGRMCFEMIRRLPK